MQTRPHYFGIVLLLALLLVACGGQEPAAATGDRIPIERGIIQATVNATGNVEANAERAVALRAPGRIAELLVAEGEAVEADQVVARLETAELELAMRQAEANVATSAARLAQLERQPSASEKRAAEAALASAEAAFEALPEEASDVQRTAAEAQLAQAESQLDRLTAGPAEEDVRAAEAALAQAELAQEQAARNLAEAELRAPIAGIVAQINVEVGDLAPSGQPILTVVDLTSFGIEVQVDEVDIGQVEVGDPVTVAVDAVSDQPFEGTIAEIGTLPTIIQGVITYPVRVVLDAAAVPGLRPGMSVTVDIVTEVREGVLLVPNRAIAIDRSSGELLVETVEGEGESATISEHVVEVGLRNEEQSEVLSGLSEGQTLLIRDRSERNLFGGGGE